MFLRFDPQREENELQYVRDMHLNTVRLEGKMMNDHFFDTSGHLVSENFYWLSTQMDVNDFAHSNGRSTPISKYADFTALDKLPPVQLKLNTKTESRGDQQTEGVSLENPSSH